MAKINIRSPYHIYITATNLTSSNLDLYIYEGTQTTDRPAITYAISSTAYNDGVTFEISELVKDYLDITFNGTYTPQNIWVDYQVTNYISDVEQTPETIVQLNGFDGYGYFEEGVNPQLDTDLLQSNTIIYNYDGMDVQVPVSTENTDTVKYYNGATELQSTTISTSAESNEQVNYVSYTSAITPLITRYEDRVVADGGTFITSTCLTDYTDTIIETPILADSIIVKDNDTNETTITIESIDECKYTPYNITFINKFGVLQNIWFFKRTNTTLTTSKENYKSNILVNGSYDISQHQNRILNKQGKEKLTLNSGFYDEQYNEVFTQLMLSEKVWINIANNTLPIEITSSSFAYKTSLNDILINYNIEIEYAFDKINNIR
jgi:hypothetical protein